MLSRHSIFSSDQFLTVCQINHYPQNPQKTTCKALRNPDKELLISTTMYFSSHVERALFQFN